MSQEDKSLKEMDDALEYRRQEQLRNTSPEGSLDEKLFLVLKNNPAMGIKTVADFHDWTMYNVAVAKRHPGAFSQFGYSQAVRILRVPQDYLSWLRFVRLSVYAGVPTAVEHYASLFVYTRQIGASLIPTSYPTLSDLVHYFLMSLSRSDLHAFRYQMQQAGQHLTFSDRP